MINRLVQFFKAKDPQIVELANQLKTCDMEVAKLESQLLQVEIKITEYQILLSMSDMSNDN